MRRWSDRKGKTQEGQGQPSGSTRLVPPRHGPTDTAGLLMTLGHPFSLVSTRLGSKCGGSPLRLMIYSHRHAQAL